MIMLNECEQLWASLAAQALDAPLTNHVVAPSVNPVLNWWNRMKHVAYSNIQNVALVESHLCNNSMRNLQQVIIIHSNYPRLIHQQRLYTNNPPS